MFICLYTYIFRYNVDVYFCLLNNSFENFGGVKIWRRRKKRKDKSEDYNQLWKWRIYDTWVAKKKTKGKNKKKQADGKIYYIQRWTSIFWKFPTKWMLQVVYPICCDIFNWRKTFYLMTSKAVFQTQEIYGIKKSNQSLIKTLIAKIRKKKKLF